MCKSQEGEPWVQPTLSVHSNESPRWGRSFVALSLFPQVSKESQNGASEVSDRPAMQRGLVPRQVGELWCHGLVFNLPPTESPRGWALVPPRPEELPAVCSDQPVAAEEKLLFHLPSCRLQFLCHHTFWSSLSLMFE